MLPLYFFAGSCAAQTTRLELEYKGLAHELVYLLPVAHGFILGIRGFPRQSVPALELDGRRAAVEEAEQWGEHLQDAARRILYYARRVMPEFPSAWPPLLPPHWLPR